MFRHISITALALLAGVALSSATAQAQETFWQVSNGDWSYAGDWKLGVLPTVDIQAYIENGGTATITQSGEICKNLSVGGGGETPAGSGFVQMTDGQFQIPGNTEWVGYTGLGVFTQSGGTNQGFLVLGYYNGNGAYNLTGSGLLSSPEEWICDSGTGNFTQTAGTNSIGSGGLWFGQKQQQRHLRRRQPFPQRRRRQLCAQQRPLVSHEC